MQRRYDRQRQQMTEQADNRERQRRAEHRADQRPDRREHHHLGQVNREHVAAGAAERLERGDHLAAAVDMALDRVGDADAANQQRGQPDQRQKLGEARDRAFKLRRGVVARADFPSGLRQLAARIIRQRIRGAIAAVVQPDAVNPAHQAARLQQRRSAQCGLADQKARREPDPAGKLVRL
jgi:hypothetical protein